MSSSRKTGRIEGSSSSRCTPPPKAGRPLHASIILSPQYEVLYAMEYGWPPPDNSPSPEGSKRQARLPVRGKPHTQSPAAADPSPSTDTLRSVVTCTLRASSTVTASRPLLRCVRGRPTLAGAVIGSQFCFLYLTSIALLSCCFGLIIRPDSFESGHLVGEPAARVVRRWSEKDHPRWTCLNLVYTASPSARRRILIPTRELGR